MKNCLLKRMVLYAAGLLILFSCEDSYTYNLDFRHSALSFVYLDAGLLETCQSNRFGKQFCCSTENCEGVQTVFIDTGELVKKRDNWYERLFPVPMRLWLKIPYGDYETGKQYIITSGESMIQVDDDGRWTFDMDGEEYKSATPGKLFPISELKVTIIEKTDEKVVGNFEANVITDYISGPGLLEIFYGYFQVKKTSYTSSNWKESIESQVEKCISSYILVQK